MTSPAPVLAQKDAGPSQKPSLRDHILSSISILPNDTDLELTVLRSSPKRTSALFPHAEKPPKCFEREYLVTVSSRLDTLSTSSSLPLPKDGTTSSSSLPLPEDGCGSASKSTTSTSPNNPKVLVVGISAHLYTLSQSNPPTSILYISKVDTSGHLNTRLPLTRALVVSFVTYFMQRSTRLSEQVSVHLFARSQSQYLFPNSALVQGKRVAGGLGLCGWWKGVYEDIVLRLSEHLDRREKGTKLSTQIEGESLHSTQIEGEPNHVESAGDGDIIKLRYMLPSYEANEAESLLGTKGKRRITDNLQWDYAPPFLSHLFDSPGGIATLIPSLPDDPKTRFLEELVTSSTTELDHNSQTQTHTLPQTQAQTQTHTRPQTQAPKPTDSQTTQEGRAVTTERRKRNAEEEEMERKRAQGILSKVSPEEFWTRLGFRQECAQDPTGFFTLSVRSHNGANSPNDTVLPHKPHQNLDLPPAIVERLRDALLNCDFATLDLAVQATRVWSSNVERIVSDEIGAEGYRGCVGVVPAKEGLTASVGDKRKEEVVTVLQVRKKKKA